MSSDEKEREEVENKIPEIQELSKIMLKSLIYGYVRTVIKPLIKSHFLEVINDDIIYLFLQFYPKSLFISILIPNEKKLLCIDTTKTDTSLTSKKDVEHFNVGDYDIYDHDDDFHGIKSRHFGHCCKKFIEIDDTLSINQ